MYEQQCWARSGTLHIDARPISLITPLQQHEALWSADCKGEFMLGNRRYCYPLTITDFASRYLLTCEALVELIGSPHWTISATG